MKATRNIFFLFLVCFFSIQTAFACQLTETTVLWDASDICIGGSKTIGHNSCPSHPNDIFEWHIERCANNNQFGSMCTSFSPFDTRTQVGPGALNYTFLVPGTYRITLFILDPVSLNPVAVPCSTGGAGTCNQAIVNVVGPSVPSFNVTSLNCTFDAQTGTFTQTVSINPAINHTVTGTVNNTGGTDLVIDWGDGTTSNLQNLSAVGSNIVQHTYTWQQQNNQNPNYVISVQAINGNCPALSYSRSFQPVPNFAFIIPDVIEADCHQQVVCFGGTENFESFHWLDPNGVPFGFNQDCLTFTQPGTFTLVADNPGECPFIFSYEVVFLPTNVGVLYSNDSHLQAGAPLDLNVNNTTGEFIIYEIYSGSCNPTPVWVPFAFGDAASMMNHTVPWYVTQYFLPCMLNSNFEFCIRAKVFCEEPPSLTTPGAVTNVICFKVCAGEDISWEEPPFDGLAIDEEGIIDAELDEGLAGLKQEHAMEVYPNPASNEINMKTALSEGEQELVVRLKNINGRQVLTKAFQVEGAKMFEDKIELPSVPAGMYILEVHGKATSRSAVIVIDN